MKIKQEARRQEDWEMEPVEDEEVSKSFTKADNCGTGAGGFQPGNDCAAEDGSSSDKPKAAPGTDKEKQRAQTKTPEFKQWFGDSQVVGDDGEPLVVYHQTTSEFDTFDRDMTTQGVFWFTESKAQAESGQTGASRRAGDPLIVKEVYLSAQNLAGWDEYERLMLGQIQSQGFDGIKLDDVYIVFDPNQIKSATDNEGDFDSSNANITKAADNCGTGAGGFQPGNDCAAGDGGPKKEGGSAKVRTGELTEEEIKEWDEFASRKEVDDEGKNSGQRHMDGEDWTSPDGHTYEHDEDTIAAPGNEEWEKMGGYQYHFLDDGSTPSDSIYFANDPESRKLTDQTIAKFGTDARNLSEQDIEAIQRFTGSEYVQVSQSMRQERPETIRLIDDKIDAANDAQKNTWSLEDADKILSMSDKEIEEHWKRFSGANKSLRDSCIELHRSIKRARDIARQSSSIDLHDSLDESVNLSNEMWGAAGDLLSRPTTKESINDYRTAVKDFASYRDQFEQTYKSESENTVSGYKEIGNRINSLASNPLRADGEKMTVYRGVSVKGPGRKRLYDAINSGAKTYQLDGIASSSTNGFFASGWTAGNHQIIMKMNVSKGLYVEPISQVKGEDEVILPKGIKFDIKSVNRVSGNDANGFHGTAILVEMEEVDNE